MYNMSSENTYIYIPIWLDLLFFILNPPLFLACYLHSNMVRFIMVLGAKNYKLQKEIYIPIWLDLLFQQIYKKRDQDLLFTFQYG